MAILKQQKEELDRLIGLGHRAFGSVAPRRPYRDDEDTGDGAPSLTVETHPLLAQQPQGAASDLTFIATDNSEITKEAEARQEELNPQLQNRLQNQLQAELQYSNSKTPKPSPF